MKPALCGLSKSGGRGRGSDVRCWLLWSNFTLGAGQFFSLLGQAGVCPAVMSPCLWGIRQHSPRWQNLIDFPTSEFHSARNRSVCIWGSLGSPVCLSFSACLATHRATLPACCQSRKETRKMEKDIYGKKKRRGKEGKGFWQPLALPTQPALT